MKLKASFDEKLEKLEKNFSGNISINFELHENEKMGTVISDINIITCK